MNEWIKIENCLPSCDGVYEVMGYLHIKPVLAFYNGIGFLVDNSEYYSATIWRKPFIEENKRYGKQK